MGVLPEPNPLADVSKTSAHKIDDALRQCIRLEISRDVGSNVSDEEKKDNPRAAFPNADHACRPVAIRSQQFGEHSQGSRTDFRKPLHSHPSDRAIRSTDLSRILFPVECPSLWGPKEAW